MRHVILTGEIGVGKSTVLRQMLRLLDVRAEGIETGAYVPREVKEKTLCMRAYGDSEKGCPFARLPGGDKAYAARCFDAVGVQLLCRARRLGELIVIDELGRLECDAKDYQHELRITLDGNLPVLAVLRQNKAEWADWIRERPDIELLTVVQQNRDYLPEIGASILAPQIRRKNRACLPVDERVCYKLQAYEEDKIRWKNAGFSEKI